MKGYKFLIFYSFFTIIVMACETEQNIKVGLDPSKIVLNSIISNDSVWSVSLTKTANVTDGFPLFEPVENAEISIYDSNNMLTETITHSGSTTSDLYLGTTKPLVGVSYELRAVLEDGSIIRAKATVPQNVPIQSYKIDSTRYKSNGEEVQMKISINDPPGIANYYLIKIIRHAYYTSGIDTIHFIEDVGYQIFDPALNKLSQSAVNDNLFDGEPHDFDFKMNRFGYQATTEKVQVQLLNISNEYYQYLSTFDLEKSTEGDPFAQPTFIFSNIENGTGILGAYNASTIDIE